MTNHVFLFAGVLVGFSIAVPVGPMAILCIQRTLGSGMATGVSTGLGAATVNVAYGALFLFGMDRIGPALATGGRALSILGGVFLLWSAVRTVRRPAPDAGRPTPRLSPLAAYASAVAFNATNPMAPMLIMALLAPVVGPAAPAPTAACMLLLGMFGAAAAWWVCLTGIVAALRSRLTPALLLQVNRVAGMVLTAYGALILARSARL